MHVRVGGFAIVECAQRQARDAIKFQIQIFAYLAETDNATVEELDAVGRDDYVHDVDLLRFAFNSFVRF